VKSGGVPTRSSDSDTEQGGDRYTSSGIATWQPAARFGGGEPVLNGHTLTAY
jgi:hypothetical protein